MGQGRAYLVIRAGCQDRDRVAYYHSTFECGSSILAGHIGDAVRTQAFTAQEWRQVKHRPRERYRADKALKINRLLGRLEAQKKCPVWLLSQLPERNSSGVLICGMEGVSC